jgi:hypothetical protein
MTTGRIEFENNGRLNVGTNVNSSRKNPCVIPPIGWFCTRGSGHPGPCAALPALECKFCGPIPANGQPHSTAQHFLLVFGRYLENNTHYKELVAAVDRDAAQGGDGIVLSKEEALILQRLLSGWVVGPSAQAVIDKLKSTR